MSAAFLQGLGLGILIGTVVSSVLGSSSLYKYLSGITPIEEEAFKAGYEQGCDDTEKRNLN